MKVDISTDTYPNTYVLIDESDAHLMEGVKWTPNGTGYAHREVSPGKKEYLHRTIIGAMAGETVDHINRDRSDNRRENLRITDDSLNARNRPGRGGSRYRGVCLSRGKWKAEIRAKGERWALGSFATEAEAAAAYDDALAFFGLAHSGLNFPDRQPAPFIPPRRAIGPHGRPGVRQLSSGRFNVRVMVDGKRVGLGTFATVEEANAAWEAKHES